MFKVVYAGFTFNNYSNRVHAFIEFANNDKARYIKDSNGVTVSVETINEFFRNAEENNIRETLRPDGSYYYTLVN